MLRIYISGISGFVGRNLATYLSDQDLALHSLNLRSELGQDTLAGADVVIHLAGKAHDVKNISAPGDYYETNFELTKKLYDLFLASEAKKFIFISSVKAATDHIEEPLTEDHTPDPQTHYGKSKLLAEQYIQDHAGNSSKKTFILRPCMIHGPGNKGNLNLLYKLIDKGIPWPLGAFENQRSFLSIENLCFVIKELINRNDIPPGIYQVADDRTLSTNELVSVMAMEMNKKTRIFTVSKKMVKAIAKINDLLHLPMNSETLQKLTDSFVVSNKKIVGALGKPLPVEAVEGIAKTVRAFKKNKTNE